MTLAPGTKIELAKLFESNRRPLYAFILTQVRTLEDAEDAFQETARVLCEQFDTYDPEKPFFSWACGVAWRKVISQRRNASRLRLLVDNPLGEELAEKVAASIARVDPRLDLLRECLDSLKPESREIVERRYCKEDPVGSIAAGLGVSESCVYKTLTKICGVLLDCIEGKLKENR